ncbi:MAG: signal peptidase II [Sporolactobacillus sp.]
MIYYLLALVIVLLDQGSKWLVATHMTIGESVTIIPHVFYLTSIRNTGAAWSIFQGQFIFFFVVTAIVLIAVFYYLQKFGRSDRLLGTSLGLIIGGTLGNFIDRLFRGEVVDFIHIYIIHYNYPVFNLADSSLFIGVGLLLIYLLRDSFKKGAS